MRRAANAIDPVGEKLDEKNMIIIKQKKIDYPQLQEKIEEMTKTLIKKMKIPETASTVNLTYVSSTEIKPTIIY